MKVIRQASSHADAIQWLGTPESLKEIQRLLFPMSPLFGGNFAEELNYRTLGVMITGAEKQFNQLLDHIKPNGWVIRDGDAVSIMRDDVFRKMYTQAPMGDVAAPYRDLLPGESIKATHPRAKSLFVADSELVGQ